MFLRLLLLLTVIPIVELFVLLKVHHEIAERTDFQTALLVTVGSILATGAIGAYLARTQGLGVVNELRRATAEGRFPGRPLVDGALILAGGAMLLTPGFLTDFVGLSLLIPMTRRFYRRAMTEWLRRKVERGEAFVQVRRGPGRDDWSAGPPRGQVIDVTPDEHDER